MIHLRIRHFDFVFKGLQINASQILKIALFAMNSIKDERLDFRRQSYVLAEMDSYN